MIFLTGGARSGKSRLAVEIASRGGGPVRYIATALPSDDEMERRIASHRRGRPDGWNVIEAPIEVAESIDGSEPEEFVVLDCVTLWISNLIVDHDDDEITERVDAVVSAIRDRDAALVVSNEVGSGLVPMDPIGRRFRDLQGSANQRFAAAAARSYLVIAGRTLELGMPGAG